MENKSDSHETWKCVDPELEWQICCFPYGKRSDVPQLQQVEQKAVGWQRNLGLINKLMTLSPVVLKVSQYTDTVLNNQFKRSEEIRTIPHISFKNESFKIKLNIFTYFL